MAGLIVVDASALIAYLDADDTHHDDAVPSLIAVDRFLVHPVTLAEVLVHPVRRGTEMDVRNTLITIGLRESPMTIDPVSLARLRVETGLKMPDTLVVATAIWHDAAVLAFDARLRAAAASRGLLAGSI